MNQIKRAQNLVKLARKKQFVQLIKDRTLDLCWCGHSAHSMVPQLLIKEAGIEDLVEEIGKKELLLVLGSYARLIRAWNSGNIRLEEFKEEIDTIKHNMKSAKIELNEILKQCTDIYEKAYNLLVDTKQEMKNKSLTELEKMYKAEKEKTNLAFSMNDAKFKMIKKEFFYQIEFSTNKNELAALLVSDEEEIRELAKGRMEQLK